MYVVRRWSVRHSRLLRTAYQVVEAVLNRLSAVDFNRLRARRTLFPICRAPVQDVAVRLPDVWGVSFGVNWDVLSYELLEGIAKWALWRGSGRRLLRGHP